MKYYIEIHVMGKGEFPFDMLRFGNMFPVDPDSAANLTFDHNDRQAWQEVREIRLGCYAQSPVLGDQICQRFASFLWGAKVWNVTLA